MRRSRRMPPPPQASDHRIGSVTAALSSRVAQRIEVGGEGEIAGPEAPRLYLDFPRKGGGSVWWLFGHEAAALGAFLRRAVAAIRTGQPGPIGELETEPPPWLRVTVQAAPYLANDAPLRVCLRFDDRLVRESGSDGLVWLTSAGARILARQLAEAIEWETAHPPRFYGS